MAQQVVDQTDAPDHRSAKADAKAAKARAKAMRPWFKKKRFLLPLALVVVVVAAMSMSGGGDETKSTTAPALSPTDDDSGVRTLSGNTDNPPEADVTVKRCFTDDLGWMAADLELVNNSSKASNYMVEVAFEGDGGATQLGTGNAYVSGLEPGQKSAQTANSATDAAGEFTCRITSVDRFAA